MKLIKELQDYLGYSENKLYSPLPHDFLQKYDCHNPDRSGLILEALKKHKGINTVADIGTLHGSNCYPLYKDYKTTAIEYSYPTYKVLVWLRDVYGANFECKHADVLNLDLEYDAIISTNLFHHFCKTKEKYEAMIEMLKRAKFKVMIFQTGNVAESQMEGAYKKLEPLEFANLIKKVTGKKNVKLVADLHRPIYKIY
jgi:hypothetical protein